MDDCILFFLQCTGAAGAIASVVHDGFMNPIEGMYVLLTCFEFCVMCNVIFIVNTDSLKLLIVFTSKIGF